ncbi:hypothetical protein CDD82_3619 [Ophiocordyceps australis]|uniref:Major facilitator superfamily (MFS) profile domain-containing protein n=1 Tax=Ophiocordyceps australis TaxID=1399860 RepID=A0A2C5ZUG4_9HYPO|nr:hypothetical protein CDD82_3619 [Ophiocordyceps australis]
MDHNTSWLSDGAEFLPPGTSILQAEDSSNGTVTRQPTPSDDPNDPLAWPLWRKSINYALLMTMTVVIFTALNVQIIFWNQMLEDMDVTLKDLTNAQAIQLVGLALGCVFIIPFAQKYGRRTVYIISTAGVTIGTWWSANMKSSAEVYLTNLLLGLAGAANETAVQMSIRDMFFVHQRGTANGLYLAAVTAGAFLTPMAAGAQAEATGFRSSYTTLAAFMTCLTVIFVFLFEETKFVPVIIASVGDVPISGTSNLKALEAEGKLAPVSSQDHEALSPPARKPWPRCMRLQLLTPTSESLLKTFLAPTKVWWFPAVAWTGFEFASGICWVVVNASIISIVFAKEPYNFNAAQIGFMSGGPFVGSVIGSIYGGPLVDWAIIKFAKRNNGIFEPEMRLWLMPFPAVAMSAGLIMFGATADMGMHWIFPSLGAGLFALGFGAISDITFTLVIDSYPNLVAQTFVVIAFFRNLVSIAGPFSITPWMDAMSVTAIFCIAGAISMVIHLFGIALVIYGKKWRAAIAPRYNRLSEQNQNIL